MPRQDRKVLKKHAEYLAAKYAPRMGVGDPFTIISLIIGGINLWFRICPRSSGVGAMRALRASLSDQYDGANHSPRLVAVMARDLQRSFRRGGKRLEKRLAIEMVEDSLECQRRATDDDMLEACAEGWAANGGEE
jgi:hypothetical protein